MPTCLPPPPRAAIAAVLTSLLPPPPGASASLAPAGPAAAVARQIRRNDGHHPGAAVGMSSASVAERERESEAGEFTEVVVVRHGETAWNASRIIQGHLDVELNEIGRQQAVAVARRLSNEAKPAAIYSSDLKRAAETAEIIAKACSLPNVVFDPALRERHIGDLQGLKYEDAGKEKPEAYRAFLSHKRNRQIPGLGFTGEGAVGDLWGLDDWRETRLEVANGRGSWMKGDSGDGGGCWCSFSYKNFGLVFQGGGESLDQLSERCVSCLYNIVEKHQGERIILVSHGGTIRELYRHASPMKPLHGKIHNTSVSVILVSGATGRCIVKACGDISHLKETGVLENAFGGDKNSA
ncbi:hypothetical protein OsI_29592 [Oryza sativa Indica Group]|uniref:Uncharacterized protein n=1 Tax=Oryza sativa subsp. indica TaxID=39946 RepID=B8BBV1_ORYSI|nr:hypothetical protein OsI_29592 [Oryza sativa Indica Group]